MSDTKIFDKILAGIVAKDANIQAVAEELRRNIRFFSTCSVPGVPKKDPRYTDFPILWLFDDAPLHKKLAEIVVRFHAKMRVAINADTLKNHLLSVMTPPEEMQKILFIFEQACNSRVSEGDFQYWVRNLLDRARSDIIGEAVVNATQALKAEFLDDKSKVKYSGPEGFFQLLDEVRRQPGMEEQNALAMPSGNVRDEYEGIRASIDAASKGIVQEGIVYTGFRFIDSVTGGCRPGEFILIGAATGEGKTQFSTNMAWHAAVEQSRDVLVITLESARNIYIQRLLSRHSNKPGVGRPTGIPQSNIKSGNFADETERKLFERVLDDFCNNPAYGILDVAQGTAEYTMRDVQAKADDFSDKYGKPPSLVIVDYLGIMAPTRNRGPRREEVEQIMREAKSFATSYQMGRGTVLVAPHQIKTMARENVRAEEGKFYTIRDFADTAEAGKSADVAVMMLRTPEMRKNHQLMASIVKSRDSDNSGELVTLFERFETSLLKDASVGALKPQDNP